MTLAAPTAVEAECGIRQLQARYTDAVWRKDYAAFANCFTTDGEWRISGQVFRGRTEIEAMIGRILDNFHRVLITFRTPIVDLTQVGATARTYITEKCAWKNGETNISIGLYFEHLVQEPDGWRFAWRLFQQHYRGPPDLTGTFFDNPDYGPPPAMPPRDALTANTATKRWRIEDQGKD